MENINNFEKIGDMINEGHRGDNLSGYEKDGVYFDHNGDRVLFKTLWINPDDEILVLDKNNNNTIDNGR